MTRKPLPKAITRPLATLRDGTGRIVTDEEAPASPPRSRAPRAKSNANGGVANPEAANPEIADPGASHSGVKAEAPLAVSSAPIANDLAPALSEKAKAFAAKRLALAHKIVNRHRTYAAAGGLSPLPIVNVASITAVNMHMVKLLSDIYQVPFQRDRTRAMIIGLMGGAVPSGLGLAAASTLAFVMPAAALVGLGVSAVSAATVTRAIGRVFIESFESGANALG